MCAYDSCRLLAINLYSYVKNPFTDKAEFDFELFSEHVQKGQKLMDDLIDLEIEKIEKNNGITLEDFLQQSALKTREVLEKIHKK